MAVQAQYLAHAFPRDPSPVRPALDNATSAPAFLGEPGGGGHLLAATVQAALGGDTVFSDPRSELTCNNNNNNNSDSGCFVARKRARVGDVGAGLIMEAQRALLPPVPVQVQVPQAFAPAADVQRSVLCSGAASTCGRHARDAPAAHGLLSHLHRHSVEIDAIVRIENERLRAGLQEARRRHIRAVVSSVERAAARRLRDTEAELEHALVRNAELEEKLRQTSAEGQAWLGIAKSHETVVAGLRATLDDLLQPPCGGAGAGAGCEGDAEDAQSCCYEQEEGAEASGRAGSRACKSCGGADACVLLLPCRHLCLCGACEAAVEACPVCAATKNASLHVLLP